LSVTTATTTIVGEEVEDPISVFLYALKAPETKRQYPRRLKVFLDYLKLEGTLDQQAGDFLSKAKQNPQWAQSSLMQFIGFQKERAGKEEIAYSTITNYYKATKLFLEMNSDSVIYNMAVLSNNINHQPGKAKKMFESCVKNGGNCASKAKETLTKMEKAPQSEWFEWWFGGSAGKRALGSLVVALLIGSIVAVISLTTYRPLTDKSVTNISSELTGLTVIIGILAGILLLPSLKKLKVGDVELDTVPIATQNVQLSPILSVTPISIAMALQDPLESFLMPLLSFNMPLRYPLKSIQLPLRSSSIAYSYDQNTKLV
jgi:hypothetical protein